MMNYITQLYDLAKQCRDNAYAPYSRFKVGSAIRCGHFFCGGCNVENISYPCGICAEAGAVAALAAAGYTNIDEIMIVADTENIIPCGSCLQKISEFGTPDTIIYSADLNGNIRTYRLSELLPHNFNASEVKNA